MQRTSSAYKREQALPVAGAVLVKITFGLVDTDAATTAEVRGTAGAPFSSPQTIVFAEGAPERVYATLEPGRMPADGQQLVPPHSAAKMRKEGFVSAGVSGADGSFAVPPAVEISFYKTHTVPALTLGFDAATGDYPSTLCLQAWRGEAVIKDELLTPDSAEYIAQGEIERFDRIKITFLATAKPYRRARLQQVLFGLGLVFTNKVISTVQQSNEVDPISRRLPQGTLRFSLVNTNEISGAVQGMYNPDNPKGVWKYIEQQSPIRIEYGQEITQGLGWHDVASEGWEDIELNTWGGLMDGGYVEWIPGGRYYLDAAPQVSGLFASFAAKDVLGMTDAVYHKGVFDGMPHSLYQLARQVLEDAGLPQLYANKQPWVVWEGLQEVTTTAPLPVAKHRELLQLIAHAGRCVLFVDRDGLLHIEPSPTVPQELSIDFSSMLAAPKATKIPTLLAVDCPAYHYGPAEAVTELHKGEYAVEGTLALHIEFSAAVVAGVTVQGGTLAAQQCYAAAADLVLTGSGPVTLEMKGHVLQTSQTLVHVAVAGADENGTTEVLNNPLITDLPLARGVAQWVQDYLLNRTTYELECRGNPECDPLDNISLQSAFDPAFPAIVLKNEVNVSGGVRGKMTCKRMVKHET